MDLQHILESAISEAGIDIDCTAGKEKTLWLAFSGGLDSTVLLHLLAHSAWRGRIRALHVHHGLAASANQWASHCQHVCDGLEVPLTIAHVKLGQCDKGVEQAARMARYRAFARVLAPNELLLLAHHQDDQAETLLFRLMRGAGLRGLGAMHSLTERDGIKLLRPLLRCSKAMLQGYAEQHHLSWIEDDSNASEIFDRNYLRHQVIPSLVKRWPSATTQMSATAERLREQMSLLDEYVQQDFLSLKSMQERVGESIDLGQYLRFSTAKQKALLHYWCTKLARDLPSEAHLSELATVTQARQDASPCLSWGNTELRRFRSRLYLLPTLDPCEITPTPWDGHGSLNLGAGFYLQAQHPPEDGAGMPLFVRDRAELARCQPRGRQQSQSIKKLFQEYQLEPWLRSRVPFIYYKDALVAVADLWRCDTQHSNVDFGFHWYFRG